jgi:predicted NBD/HSP70 family sugar kinase
MIALGIDIGGTAIKVAAVRDGEVPWTRRSAAYARPDRAQLIAALREAAARNAEELPERTDAIGLCVPGLLDPASRTIISSANVPGLLGAPLDAILAAALGPGLPPATLLSDAVATAADVYVSRRLTGRLFLLALGTGVGAAVWDAESGPLRVDGDSPGHFGQLDVSLDDHPPLGPDGGAGSLEAYIGAPALRRQYGDDFYAKLPTLAPDAPPLRALARAIRIGQAIYRPHHVCLAGGIGIALKPALPGLRARIDEHLTNIARPGWTLSCGDHEYHAAIGAARLAGGGGNGYR